MYQDIVLAYEQKEGLVRDIHSSPRIAFARRGHAAFLALARRIAEYAARAVRGAQTGLHQLPYGVYLLLCAVFHVIGEQRLGPAIGIMQRLPDLGISSKWFGPQALATDADQRGGHPLGCMVERPAVYRYQPAHHALIGAPAVPGPSGVRGFMGHLVQTLSGRKPAFATLWDAY